MHKIAIVEVGEEVGLPLPDAVVERLGLRIGDTLYLREHAKGIELTTIAPALAATESMPGQQPG